MIQETNIELPETVSEITWEELLQYREKMSVAKEAMEAALKVISDECLERLNKEKLNGKLVGNFTVTKISKMSFDTSLESAQELGATKMVVDQGALKKLFLEGIPVPGVKKTEYVMIKEVSKGE